MEQTELERRQALCRAIFLLDDDKLRSIENMVIIVQSQMVQEKLGIDRLPLSFGTDLFLQEHARKIRHYFKNHYQKQKEKMENKFNKQRGT